MSFFRQLINELINQWINNSLIINELIELIINELEISTKSFYNELWFNEIFNELWFLMNELWFLMKIHSLTWEKCSRNVWKYTFM